MRKIVYPGTFNPITNGHIDLIERASTLFDQVVVALGTSPQKKPSTSLHERVELTRQILSPYKNVEVCYFTALLVDFVRSQNSKMILRGLRTVADFEYEFQLVSMNKKLAPEIETVFLAPSDNVSHISSTLVREIAAYGGDVSPFVPAPIVKFLEKQYKKP